MSDGPFVDSRWKVTFTGPSSFKATPFFWFAARRWFGRGKRKPTDRSAWERFDTALDRKHGGR